MEEKIMDVLNIIRPALQNDGGDLEFIKYEDNYVHIKLLGGCSSCPFKNDTLQSLIFETLKEAIPEIEGVINTEL